VRQQYAQVQQARLLHISGPTGWGLPLWSFFHNGNPRTPQELPVAVQLQALPPLMRTQTLVVACGGMEVAVLEGGGRQAGAGCWWCGVEDVVATITFPVTRQKREVLETP